MKLIFKLFLFLGLNFSLQAAEFEGDAARIQLLTALQCPKCDLSQVDLSGEMLAGANLQGANLSGANLNGTNLRGANLQGALMLDLNLSDTLLSGANLKQADLSDLDIDMAFEYIEIIGTQFEGARFKDGIVCGPPPNKGGWGCQHL